MAQTYAHFPHEFNRNIIRELDPRFWTIFFSMLVVYFSLIFYMKSIPYIPNLASQQKLLAKLYQVDEVTTEIKVTDLTQARELKEKEEELKKEEEKQEKVLDRQLERAKITDEQRKADRAQKSKDRAERTNNLKQKVAKMNIFSAAGSRSGAIGKSGGKGSGKNFGNIVGSNRGIKGGGASLSGGSGKVVQGGTIYDENANIEIVDGGTPTDIVAGELGGGLEMEEIEEVTGAGAQENLRSPEILNAYYQSQKGRLTRCFERYKKRDPQLNGRVTIGLTILPGGSTDRISIQSQWSNRTLGAQVDECIRKLVEKWHFDPIEKGDVKLEPIIRFY